MKLKQFCPICKKPVLYEKGREIPPHFPFCSERCKMVDLGKWLTDEYAIEGELHSEDHSEGGEDGLE